MKNSFIIYIIVIFIVLTALFFGVQMQWPEYNLTLLMAGNLIMALLSVATFFIVKKQLNEKPQAFVRGVYSASFLKMIVCMFSILIYVMLHRNDIHKPSLFMLFGIYAVYTSVETWLLSKMAKNIK